MGDLATCSLRQPLQSQPGPPLRVWTGRMGVCRLGVRQPQLARTVFAESGAGGLVVGQRTEGVAVDRSLALGDMGLAGGWDRVAGAGTPARMEADPTDGALE